MRIILDEKKTCLACFENGNDEQRYHSGECRDYKAQVA